MVLVNFILQNKQNLSHATGCTCAYFLNKSNYSPRLPTQLEYKLYDVLKSFNVIVYDTNSVSGLGPMREAFSSAYECSLISSELVY